jgi:hypothetical protein
MKYRILLFIVLCGFLTSCGSSSSGGSNNNNAVSIKTEKIGSAQTGKDYNELIEVAGGSGEYTIEATGLPGNLMISNEGLIYGTVNSVPGNYKFSIKVTDSNYNSNYAVKEFSLDIVSILPDEYEPDNSFPTGSDSEDVKINAISPGISQNHTIDVEDDIDTYVLDLTKVAENDLIIISCSYVGNSRMSIELYDSFRTLVQQVGGVEGANTVNLKFYCDTPNQYFVKTKCDSISEYTIKVINANSPVELIKEDLPFAQSITPYNHVLQCNNSNKTIKYEVSSGSLPGGLTLNSDTGQISGFNFNNGVFNFKIRAYESNIPENYDEKEFSITAYIGYKVTASDVEKYLSWTQGSLEVPAIGTGTFQTVVQASHPVVFEEYNFPDELTQWADTTYFSSGSQTKKYIFDNNTGSVKMAFVSRQLNTNGGGYINNDYALIRNLTTNTWLTHTIKYKVFDEKYPDNFAIFTYKVNMEIK